MHSRNSLLIDTGFFLALSDKKDPLHKKAKKIGILLSEREWITTLPVLTEICHMLPQKNVIELLRDHQKGLFTIFSLKESDYPRVLELMEKYQEHEIDLADISLIILAEFLNHGDILSCDKRDFSMLRWNGTKHFNNKFLNE